MPLIQRDWCHSQRIFGQRHQNHTHEWGEGRVGREGVSHLLSEKKDLRAMVLNFLNAMTL